jgi:NitT/TauT family transport system substrate-binding protein
MTKITMQLDWKPNSQFAGVLYADHKGWYSEAGLDVTLVPGHSSMHYLDAFDIPGNVIVSLDGTLFIKGRAAGKPIKAIAAMFQKSPLGWMMPKSSGIRSISDFKGKRIGAYAEGQRALDLVLTKNGMTRDDLTVVEVKGFDYYEVLNSGELDAIQCFVMIEPVEVSSKGLDLHIISATDVGYEAGYTQTVATTDHLLDAEPEAVTKFLKVTFDGWRYALQHPGEIAQIIAEHYLPEADAKMEEQKLRALEPIVLGDVGMERLGWMDRQKWERNIKHLISQGLIEPVQVEEVMTLKFIEATF